jgi:hypothetical protein
MDVAEIGCATSSTYLGLTAEFYTFVGSVFACGSNSNEYGSRRAAAYRQKYNR